MRVKPRHSSAPSLRLTRPGLPRLLLQRLEPLPLLRFELAETLPPRPSRQRREQRTGEQRHERAHHRRDVERHGKVRRGKREEGALHVHPLRVRVPNLGRDALDQVQEPRLAKLVPVSGRDGRQGDERRGQVEPPVGVRRELADAKEGFLELERYPRHRRRRRHQHLELHRRRPPPVHAGDPPQRLHREYTVRPDVVRPPRRGHGDWNAVDLHGERVNEHAHVPRKGLEQPRASSARARL
mmetsp:Transcript_5796/g.26779  ORF Transcript_5796/g.26779 Transcript_5796/m.26779 type:complete len:240 (+) Transcript_5796:1056-1775(+)